MLKNDDKQAIQLSKQALNSLSDTDQMGVMGNLVYLYAYTNQFEQAHQLLKQYTDQYKFDTDGIEFITETVADMEDMYKKELAKSKGATPPEIEPADASVPEKFTFHPTFPNPCNPSATIRFDLPEQSRVHITVYNILGKEVWTYKGGNAFFETGYHSIIWNGVYNNGQSVSTGIYIVKISGQGFSGSRKILLLK
ncbi:MAG: T9SS type A sorting domain-containing protein [Candidatus Marinimicrobia bacterium]|nr:T9SS type A sorting domain-containing protein [Candidatus Neomarinimicrobiota bacterium]